MTGSIDFRANGAAQALINSALLTDFPVTMLAWAKIDAFPDNPADPDPGILCLDASGNNNNWLRLRRQFTNSYRAMQRTGGTFATAAGATDLVVEQQWQHWAGVFESTTARHVYLDGGNKVSNTDTLAFPTGLNETRIGNDRLGPITPSADWNWPGWLARVALLSIAASDAQIAQVASGAASITDVFDAGDIVAYWPGGVLTVGPDTFMEDVSGNGNHAELLDGAVWDANEEPALAAEAAKPRRPCLGLSFGRLGF